MARVARVQWTNCKKITNDFNAVQGVQSVLGGFENRYTFQKLVAFLETFPRSPSSDSSSCIFSTLDTLDSMDSKVNQWLRRPSRPGCPECPGCWRLPWELAEPRLPLRRPAITEFRYWAVSQ